MITLAEHRADMRDIRNTTDLSHALFKGYRTTRRLIEGFEAILLGESGPPEPTRVVEFAEDVKKLSAQLEESAKRMLKLAGGRRG